MAKIVTKTLAWGASPDTSVVSYDVFWSVPPAPIDYTSPNVNVGNVLQIPLPIPGMPTVNGNLTIGVASVDDAGNVSDIMSATFPFRFQAPAPPGMPHLI